MTEKDKIKHIEGILNTIRDNPIFTFTDIFVYYKKIGRTTAYNSGLNDLDEIKEAIYANKRKGVTSMLAKWVQSDNPTLQIAAMRILCETEEHKKLNQQYHDHTSGGKPIIPQIIFSDDSNED